MTSVNEQKTVPVIILGGSENTLSIVRSLGKKNIPVHVIASKKSPAFNSRFCKHKYPVPENSRATDYYKQLLFTDLKEELGGSVVFACSDDAIEFIIEHKSDLKKYYKPDIQKEEHQINMLDKQKTLLLAKEFGLDIPAFWNIDSPADIDKIKDELKFPVIIKPIHSHIFQRYFKKKLLVINNINELQDLSKKVHDQGLEYMISELIPGPDSLLSSYYTHLDENGNNLFHFTKFVHRRFPVNFGGGCYHGTKWFPETAQKGEHFFRSMNFTGLGNIEFKTDPRDGKLKVIECNARFTAAQELLVQAGMDISYLIYCFLAGIETEKITSFKENKWLWYVGRDFSSFRSLRERGELTFWGWIKSIRWANLVFPVFRMDDPYPAIKDVIDYIKIRFNK